MDCAHKDTHYSSYDTYLMECNANSVINSLNYDGFDINSSSGAD